MDQDTKQFDRDNTKQLKNYRRFNGGKKHRNSKSINNKLERNEKK